MMPSSRNNKVGGSNSAAGAAASSSSQRPQVPRISRQSSSNSSSNIANEDALLLSQSRLKRTASADNNDSSASATQATTDEFGFPINFPQVQRLQNNNNGSSQIHNQQTTTIQRIDLNKVITPTHVQQQRRLSQQSSSSTSQQQQQQQLRQRPPVMTARPSSNHNNNRPPISSSTQHRSISRQHSNNSTNSSSSSLIRTKSNKSKSLKHYSNNSSNKHNHNHKPPPKLKLSKPNPQKYQNYTFQHPSHAMHVNIRYIDLNQRVAFNNTINTNNSTSSYQLQCMLDEMDRVRGSRISSVNDANGMMIQQQTNNNGNSGGGGSGKITDNPCRISPSPNHMRILEFMHGHSATTEHQQSGGNDTNKSTTVSRKRVIRQLQWNAACGVDADPWFDGQYHDDDDNDTDKGDDNDNNHYQYPRRKKPTTTSTHGDGHYIPINPLTTTLSSIPDHSPILTNIKRRLPMRSDVGFSNPPAEEITLKMEEVKKESEWEECSPRIVLLASGFSLFNNKKDNNNNNEEDDDVVVVDEIHPSCKKDIQLWAGGSIPGVPFAGRDLVMAARMSAKFENEQKKKKNSDDSHNSNSDTNDYDVNCPPPGAFSALAPPVDATFSSSHSLWRPRPFMDRPPGHVYFLACPLDIRFDDGDTEPLFCTMSLYSLSRRRKGSSTSSSGNNKNVFCGKISEDFFFPAGDWHDIEGTSRSFDDEDDEDDKPTQSWRRRKRRAIMSYDPLDVSFRNLYLVIQVYKRVEERRSISDECDANPTTPSLNKQKRRIRRTLLSSKRKSKGGGGDNTGVVQSDNGDINKHGEFSLDHTGAEHLTPFCFSATPVFANSDGQWPTGKTTQTPFHLFPSSHQSQEKFIESLIDILDVGSTSNNSAKGHVNLFTDFLGGDFTRALLGDTKEMADLSTGPLLLADVMGDCAISFEGTSAAGPATSGAGDGKKHRSDLRRLPPSTQSGYSSSCDIKEVLYFPPRSSARKYEDNMYFCSNTTINLMYIYPRLIRMSVGEKKKGRNKGLDSVSVRVQIVEQDFSEGNRAFDGAEGVYEAMSAIYNPSSPAGPPLVESFFTKSADLTKGEVKSSKAGKIKSSSSSKLDVHLREEIKVRLPDVLDRRHFLRFSIFTVNGNKCDDIIADTTIPLIISSKESISGGRVTTIMPNGLHRIQLGEEFQVHVETRLASSSHISDPSIATLLRDSPFKSDENTIVHPKFGIPFVDILYMASGNSIKRHFLTLMTANMMILGNQKSPPVYYEPLFDILGSNAAWYRLSSWETTDAVLAIIRSLFEILDKTRVSYQEKYGSIVCPQYNRLIKSFLDTFDEPSTVDNGHDTQDGGVDELMISEIHLDSTDSVDKNHDGLSSINNHLKDRGARSSKYLVKSPRSSEIKETPFSRRAYVPTRTEQLKAEAEVYDDIYAKEFFDDDETVASFSTMTSRTVFPMIVESKSILNESFTNDLRENVPLEHSNSFLTQEDGNGFTCGKVLGFDTPLRSKKASAPTPTPFSFAGKRAEYMATRVNSVAQLVLAPCVAPSMNEIMTPPRKKVTSTFASKLTGSNDKNPFDASSDVEDECKTGTPQTLRGSQACLKLPPLDYRPMKEQGDLPDLAAHGPISLYESITSLWVLSWTSFAASMKGESILEGSSETIPTWPYEVIQGPSNPSSDAIIASSFVRNASFFLPLCLKSLALRCYPHYTTKLIVPMTFLDQSHMQIFVPMVETIALGTMREAMTGGSSTASTSDQMLTKALHTISEHALDFMTGLFALLHPSQVATLVKAYFNILDKCEDPIHRAPAATADTSQLRRIKCSQQIRLYAIERLATLPRFTALNFPLKYSGSYPKKKPANNWMNQTESTVQKNDVVQSYFNKVDRDPATFWLSELLMGHCLSICHRSCQTLVVEAKAQSNALRFGREVEGALSRDDLLRIESVAFHSILSAYELLIKRHASDFRFQTAACNTRVAAMVMNPLLDQSTDAVSVLQRMEANHKVRCMWLLCVLYVLQEGPEALLRDKLSSFCRTPNQIHQFISLLKLSSTTCQYFIPGNESFCTLEGLSKEMTQETFNCISATVILLVEECIDYFASNRYEMEKLAKGVFDLLLHVTATPQSSITLLRTLGGSAHALDKFGASAFLNAVGNDLQHWGRVILTMMNSTELSVRSMAVDFFVSLLGGIYNDRGSIDDIGLSVLTVLPEVVAREISLCSVSGLINSIGDAEMALWPLRRALADVEETNPVDDDRIDPQLIPSITTFCRTGQAIIDGVFVEMRLKGASEKVDIGKIAEAQSMRLTTSFQFGNLHPGAIFDADEESLLEAANFFSPQTSPPQKLRWLFALRDLHVTKRQWSEAAETLVLGAHSLIISLEHLSNIWRPNQFDLWNDYRHSPWLKTVGLSEESNGAVMRFARSFLEPGGMFYGTGQYTYTRKLSVRDVCSVLNVVIEQIYLAYAEEEGMEDIAFAHFEELLNKISASINNVSRRYNSEDINALRRVRALICSKLTPLTEHDIVGSPTRNQLDSTVDFRGGVYVRLLLCGYKPDFLKESTTIPTYFEWNAASICRVPVSVIMTASVLEKKTKRSLEECICMAFAEPLTKALKDKGSETPIIVQTDSTDDDVDESNTYINIALVQRMKVMSSASLKTRKFYLRNDDGITEFTVGHKFPYRTSRQRCLVKSEVKLMTR